MRNIVSWFRYPLRTRARSLRFAFHAILESTLLLNRNSVGGITGYETCSLKTSAHDLKTCVSKLARVPQFDTRCARCKSLKSPINAIVADAGAMFEQIGPEAAVQAYDYAVSKLTTRGFIGVHVESTHPLKFHLTKPKHSPIGSVSFSALRNWLVSLCIQRTGCIGDGLFEQSSGLPIGGLASKVATSFVLGYMEQEFRTNQATREEKHFALDGKHDSECVSGVRYVDDIFACSKVFCENCIQAYINCTYTSKALKTTVTFDQQAQSPGQYLWLDFKITFDDKQQPRLHMAPRETEWIKGDTEYPVKWRTPRFTGYVDSTQRSIARGILIGRMCRLNEMGLETEKLDSAILEEIALWERAHWPRQELRKLANSNIKLKPFLVALINDIIHEFHHYTLPTCSPRFSLRLC